MYAWQRSGRLPISHVARRVSYLKPIPTVCLNFTLAIKLNSIMRKALLLFLLLACGLLTAQPTSAQTPAPQPGPVYIVQAGETLWEIALRFHVDLEELKQVNNISNADWLAEGQELIIPGLEDLQGYLIPIAVPLGETLHTLSRASGTPENILRRLNHLTSPTELYAGSRLILLQKTKEPTWKARAALTSGETLLELAVRQNAGPWTLITLNHLPGSWAALPDDILALPQDETALPTASGLPPVFAQARLSPLPLKQGATAQVSVRTASPVSTLNGWLVDHPLHFFQTAEGKWVALQGIHAMLPGGTYPLRLEATLPDGTQQVFEQMVLVEEAGFGHETLVVDRAYIDPAVTAPEEAQILALVNAVTTERYWNGAFLAPGYFPDCYTSRFGTRRTYIASDHSLTLEGFHTGLDFCGGSGLPIVAPAAGVVVFAGPLEVRGNATIIDHGWGVYSGFWHQSEILVQVGQRVAAGETIGKVGGTGRVTGAHLHWEIWVNGVQVDPLPWLSEAFPQLGDD